MKSCSIEKLCKLLSKWIDPYGAKGKIYRLPKNLSLLMIEDMQYVYKILKRVREAKFLMSDLVTYLEKSGIKVEAPQGLEVNYTAYPE